MSFRMAMFRAVREWTGPLPSTVGLCAAEDDLTYIVAVWRTEEQMRAVEQAEQEREQRKKHGSKNRP